MKLFAGLDSKALTVRLEDLRAREVAAGEAVDAAQESLEAAMGEGKPAEKLVSALAEARIKRDTLGNLVAQAEHALSTVRAEEERQKELRRLDAELKTSEAAEKAALDGLSGFETAVSDLLERAYRLADIIDASGGGQRIGPLAGLLAAAGRAGYGADPRESLSLAQRELDGDTRRAIAKRSERLREAIKALV